MCSWKGACAVILKFGDIYWRGLRAACRGPQLLRGSRSLRAPLFNPLYSQTVGTIETLISLGCAFAQRTLFCKMLSSHHHVTSVSVRPARGRLSSFYFRPRSPRELILVVKPLNQTKPACFLSDKA